MTSPPSGGVHHAPGRLPEAMWADIAAASGRRLDATTRWEELRPSEGTEPVDGDLDGPEAAALADVLGSFTGSADSCLSLVWTGRSGGDHLGCDLYYGGNPHVLLEGTVRAVAALHEDHVTATAWWPLDRSWFVHTALDGYDTYLGCSAEALRVLVADRRLEVLPIGPDDDVDTSPFPPYDQG